MKRFFLGIGALLGLISSLMLMAVSYLGNTLFGFPFIPFDLSDWLARHLPGGLIDANIRLIIWFINVFHPGPTAAAAKLIEQVQSLGLIAVAGLVFGVILGYLRGRRPAELIPAGMAGGVVLWVGMLLVELSLAQPTGRFLAGALWLLALLGGWGWLLARGVKGQTKDNLVEMRPDTPVGMGAMPVTRRGWLLALGGGVISLVVLLLGLRRFSQLASESSGTPLTSPGRPAGGKAVSTPVNHNVVNSFAYSPDTTSGPAASPPAAVLARRIDPAPTTRAEITPVSQFYRIDINSRPANVDSDTWRLVVKGLVKFPLSLDLGDIQAFPRVTQAVTMECISNPVGGDLISTNFWTGARLKDVLAKASLLPGVQEIAMTAGDAYYESVPIAEAMDDRTLLVYAMNGEALTPEHGFPLRIYIPGHYGMKMPKWLTTLEAIDHPASGYWVDRGWSKTAIPHTTSVIDNITVDKISVGPDGIVPLGGIAWGGKRGISKVEVQIGNGPWVAAELRTPAVSPLTWVQWRYDWKPSPGTYQVQVRATDGTGILQETRGTDFQPNGATGIYFVTIKI